MTSQEVHALVVDAYHRRVVAMPSHVTLAFNRAVQLARNAGVTFAPGEVAVYCYAGREDEPSSTFFRDRPILIYLNLALAFDTAWTRHILHEFGHAYFDSRGDIGVLQRELRADEFADRAMAARR